MELRGFGVEVRGLYEYLRVVVGFGFGAIVDTTRGLGVEVEPFFFASITSWPFSVYTSTQTLLVQSAAASEIGNSESIRIKSNLRMALS